MILLDVELKASEPRVAGREPEGFGDFGLGLLMGSQRGFEQAAEGPGRGQIIVGFGQPGVAVGDAGVELDDRIQVFDFSRSQLEGRLESAEPALIFEICLKQRARSVAIRGEDSGSGCSRS